MIAYISGCKVGQFILSLIHRIESKINRNLTKDEKRIIISSNNYHTEITSTDYVELEYRSPFEYASTCTKGYSTSYNFDKPKEYSFIKPKFCNILKTQYISNIKGIARRNLRGV